VTRRAKPTPYQPPPRPRSLAGTSVVGGPIGAATARAERRAVGQLLESYDDDAATVRQSRAAAKLGER
jgi:hypothetical protein